MNTSEFKNGPIDILNVAEALEKCGLLTDEIAQKIHSLLGRKTTITFSELCQNKKLAGGLRDQLTFLVALRRLEAETRKESGESETGQDIVAEESPMYNWRKAGLKPGQRIFAYAYYLHTINGDSDFRVRHTTNLLNQEISLPNPPFGGVGNPTKVLGFFNQGGKFFTIKQSSLGRAGHIYEFTQDGLVEGERLLNLLKNDHSDEEHQ